ncbi:hypothetical protein NS506_05327 [Nocardia seriolae]|uniref:Uncharacterized protein n=1 Tax=Nocardia seriolae TaxID=37332 RepID=A0ABC8AYX8_9NOCA|nr:hypothetical protein NS506_05327 [Nocardia seriolae]
MDRSPRSTLWIFKVFKPSPPFLLVTTVTVG